MQSAFVSIHAPRAGGDEWLDSDPADRDVSIHAPRAGGDLIWTDVSETNLPFQSTPPARGATPPNGLTYGDLARVSIHAPRAGGDDERWPHLDEAMVSIHAPRAGGDWRFVSTAGVETVSIHAPRAGGDPREETDRWPLNCFNPRPPRGGRPEARRARCR